MRDILVLRKISEHKLALSVGVGLLLTLGFLSAVIPTQAHQDPAACNASGLQQFPSIVSPAGSAHDGDTITYSVIYLNSDPDGEGAVAPCNITLADAQIERPNGTIVNVLTDATLNVGDSISCPGDAECAAGPYTYTVNHVDEVGGSVTAEFDIAGVLHQDENEEVASDHDTLSKTVIHPTTITTISSSASQVLAGGTVNLTVTEQNDGSNGALTNPHVDVDNGVGTLSNPPTSGDTNTNGVLDGGETWSWTLVGVVINASTTFTATGHGTDSTGDDVTWCANPQDPSADTVCDQDEQDSVAVQVISPSTILTKTPSATSTAVGTLVTYTYTERNDGDVPLTNVSVVDDTCSPLVLTGGDTNLNNILDPGETWIYTCSMIINETTTNTATGRGLDPLGNVVTWCDNPQDPPQGFVCDQDERASARVEVVFNPTTVTTISSSDATVLAGDTVTLTITERNDGDVDLTNPHVILNPGNLTLDETSADFDGVDGVDLGVLDPGETWTWTVDVVVNADTTYTATGHGTDPQGNDITFCDNGGSQGVTCDQDERDSVDVDVINPTTITTISSSATTTAAGGMVTLTVTEHNDGDVDLTNPHVMVDNGVGMLDETSADFDGVDAGDLGILDPGETWTWTVDVVINGTITYIATGHGTDPLGNDVTFPADAEEQDSVTITVLVFDGCTPGYWKQDQHFGNWTDPYDPGDSFFSAFGRNITIMWSAQGKPGPVNNPTLLQALNANGGGVNALARHATAALLNAANPDVEYEFSVAQVIQFTQNTIDSGDYGTAAALFASANERECPLGLAPATDQGGGDVQNGNARGRGLGNAFGQLIASLARGVGLALGRNN